MACPDGTINPLLGYKAERLRIIRHLKEITECLQKMDHHLLMVEATIRDCDHRTDEDFPERPFLI